MKSTQNTFLCPYQPRCSQNPGTEVRIVCCLNELASEQLRGLSASRTLSFFFQRLPHERKPPTTWKLAPAPLTLCGGTLVRCGCSRRW